MDLVGISQKTFDRIRCAEHSSYHVGILLPCD